MKKSILAFILVIVMLTVSACGILPGRDQSADVNTQLPKVGSFEKLKDLLSQMGNSGNYYAFDSRAVMETAGAQKSDESSQSGGGSYSGTNVQVEGVDEADIIKTDGKYIYYVNMNSVLIVDAYPADAMKVVNKITFNEESFYPYEIYSDSKYLIIIGNTYYYYPMPYIDMGEGEASEGSEGVSEEEEEKKLETSRVMPRFHSRDTVKVLIYDISTPENATLVREFETEGYYVSSRKIGSEFYLISNKYVYLYGAEETEEATILPWYRDGSKDEEFMAVDYDDIRYFPGGKDSSYLIITGLDLDNINTDLNVQAFLGSGQTIYASEKNLYVTHSTWEYPVLTDEAVDNDSTVSSDAPDRMIMPFDPAKTTTVIYRFTLNNGNAVFAAKGEVPGTLLNQFSMDEHNGHFRVATTTGEAWRDDEFTSRNNLFILNSSLVITGKIEDIAPGERIYSVRFMGDKGYMVTFKTVDPLFVLDLKDPANPSILGELKIPGYSDYLHPYDENHIIGFGMDTIEAQITDEKGNVFGTTVYQMGMKIALFDVSDVNDPKEKFSMSIGDRGTYSELLYNHKALVYSKEMNLMAFPVNVVRAPAGKPLEYGTLTFQGMQLYRIDPDNGFTLLAQFSHLTEQELKDAYTRGYDYMKTVERGLYIDDVFYTVSKGYITANSLETFAQIGTLKLQ